MKVSTRLRMYAVSTVNNKYHDMTESSSRRLFVAIFVYLMFFLVTNIKIMYNGLFAAATFSVRVLKQGT